MRPPKTHLLMIYSLVLAFVAACSPTFDATTRTPTAIPIQGEVMIDVPGSGTIVYAEVLTIAGTSHNLPPEGFRLHVTTALDEVIAETTIQPQANANNGEWQVELIHDYDGDPIEITITALPVHDAIRGDYAVASAVLSALRHRPEGIFGAILQPFPESVAGGDVIPVVGTASGVPGRTIIVTLQDGDEIISQRGATLPGNNALDEVQWTVDLLTNGYQGTATIHAYYIDADSGQQVELSQIPIQIETVAG